MGNCGDCRHFEVYEIEEFERREYPGAEMGWGTCSFLRDSESYYERHGEENPPQSDRAYPQDASGYHAWLRVRSDFGCVEFAAKD